MCWDCPPSWHLGTETPGWSGSTAQTPPSGWIWPGSPWPCSMGSCHCSLGSLQACRLWSGEGGHSSSGNVEHSVETLKLHLRIIIWASKTSLAHPDQSSPPHRSAQMSFAQPEWGWCQPRGLSYSKGTYYQHLGHKWPTLPYAFFSAWTQLPC